MHTASITERTGHAADVRRAWSVEDGLWDAAVLGPQYDAFTSWRAGQVDLRLTPRQELPPLQQVLLANAASATARATRAADARMVQRYADSNPLLCRALELYVSSHDHPACVLPGAADEYAWSALDDFYLYALTERFDDGVALLLRRAHADAAFSGERRQWLNALLFQPLQNARQHGKVEAPEVSRSFSGVAARIVSEAAPRTPSVCEWLAAVEREHPAGPLRFLEVVVHDDGPGVASHYYDSRTGAGLGAVYRGPLLHEWTFLNGAFERHATTKMFRDRTSRPTVEPGVGLAGMLGAVKRLRAYMELRTGRLRAYRWYRRDEVIADEQLLLPDELPPATPMLPGTIVRFFVPIPGGAGS